jgi:hypothetical protein
VPYSERPGCSPPKHGCILTFEDSVAVGGPHVCAGFIVNNGQDKQCNAKVRTLKVSYDALYETEDGRLNNNVVLLEPQTKCTMHRWMTRGWPVIARESMPLFGLAASSTSPPQIVDKMERVTKSGTCEWIAT